MASGDISWEYDKRLVAGGEAPKPICGLTLEIVVADGTSEKEEVLDEADHSCMNCHLNDIYFEAPALATLGKTAKLELYTERDNVIYSTGDLDATSATDHPIHNLQRGLVDKTAIKVICDANVTGAKTFHIEMRGL